jgi:hypothetical protein
MTIPRLIAIGVIFLCTCIGWALLGTALTIRTERTAYDSRTAVTGNWGPEMVQLQPRVYYPSPTDESGFRDIGPSGSEILVDLFYEPKRKGLIRHRAWRADFDGTWTVENPTPIRQTIYFEFPFPAENTSFSNFKLIVDGKESERRSPVAGKITEAVVLEPGASAPVQVRFETRGINQWRYHFHDGENKAAAVRRVRDFRLQMTTDFADIDFPEGVGSPPEENREFIDGKWSLRWEYPDHIDAPNIGMAMPKILNPGPVAQRIAFFAPVSLLFFFSAVVALTLILKTPLHPMNFFFLAASCFAFQLLFSYLVDHLPLTPSFFIAAAVSVGLVFSYLKTVAGWRFAKLAAAAQFAYVVLFSYSFFFDGISGLTIAIGAILTLGVLMKVTASMDWSTVFHWKKKTRFEKAPPKPVAG